jgi:type I restriction enzyme M protein
MPAFGKTRLLAVSDFVDFEAAYGNSALGETSRSDQGEGGRFRRFTRDEIKARNDNLDIAWLRDESADPEDELTEPDDLAAAIGDHLRAALTELESFGEELSEEGAEASI